MLLNGLPASPDALKVLALNNFGHFTSMRVDNHRVRGLNLHLDRLVDDCQRVFAADLDRAYVRDLVKQAVGGGDGSLVVRVTVFDPGLDLGHPGGEAKPQILITTRSAVEAPLPPLTLRTSNFERETPVIKHVGLFATLYQRRQAQLSGRDDVLFVDRRGLITEGATWNIAFLAGDRIVWPEGPCLPGITMQLIKELRHCEVAPIAPTDIPDWSGAFITNAAVGVRPVATIDDHGWHEVSSVIQSISDQYMATDGEFI